MHITKNIIVIIIIFIASIIVGITAFLYIKGYNIRSDDIANGTPIVKGGNLIIDSEPSGATIYINNEKKGKTKDKFFNLPAGEYEIKIKIDEFRPWGKTVSIEEGLVTEISANLIPLFPNTTPIETEFNIDKIIAFYNDNGRMLALDKQGNLWIANFQQGLLKKSNSFTKLLNAKEASKLPPNAVYLLSPDSKKLLIYKRNNPDIFIIPTDVSENNLNDLNVKLELSPTDIYWASDSKTLLIENSNLLFSYGLESKRYILLLNKADKKVNFTTQKGLIYLENNMLYMYDNFASLKKEVKLADYTLPSSVKEIPNVDKIITSPDLRLILLASDKSLYYLNDDEKQLDIVSDEFDSFKNFSPDQNKVLYCSTENNLMYFILDVSRLHGIQRSGQVGQCSEYIEWSKDSQNIISYVAALETPDDPKNKLTIKDYDGSNIYQLSEDHLLNGKFVLTEDRRIIYGKKTLSKGKNSNTSEIELIEIDLTKPEEANSKSSSDE